ncbi:MAG TPA: EAL domain-containing protein [Thermoanaerobaculia bacterium]|nr:EAL domain-containing protein [Thermoanaerobaculia bacterium]
MFDQRLTIYAMEVAQATASLVLGVLLLSFNRYYRKSYLRDWALSWVSLAIYEVTSGLALLASESMPAIHPARILLTFLAAAAGYAQPAFLVFGCYELTTRRQIRQRGRHVVLSVSIALGIALSLVFVNQPSASPLRYMARFGVRSLLAGAAFLVAAAMVYRVRSAAKGIGFNLVTVAFTLYGAELIHYFVLTCIYVQSHRQLGYSAYLGFLDFALLALIGIGMVTCLLEDEREATVLATKEIEHLAYHDSLTGLPNRALFLDRLIVAMARASRYQNRMALLFFDLDRFKEINDSLGHTVGDQLLKAVAERIRSCTREADSLARFGGDEFTLLIDQIATVDDATRVGRKIIDALKVPFRVSERELFISTSIGIGIYPDDGEDTNRLIRNADTAMYRAKEQGRDNYQLYAPAMNEQAVQRLALEQLLRKALSQNELVVFYQPLVDGDEHLVTSAEALIRWNHPELGLLSPEHFISAAEASGLILPIGNWVLQTACVQAKTWQVKYGARFGVSVNLSARQFQQADLVDQVRVALEKSGLDPGCLDLEITESNAMQNAENSIRMLRDLKKLGVRISMDDFGTGYSSLSYLKRFPIDTLKLDQSFVRDLHIDEDDRAIAEAVIAMAHSLKLNVVAEGVETQEQLTFLKEKHCDHMQGFFFSRPVPPEEFEAMISEGMLINAT